MNKKQKRLALGLVLAGLLGTGTAWASPLEQGVKPAETVLLDETDGPLSHVQKKKQDTKEKIQRKEEVRKTDEEQEKKPLSFRERIRRHRKEEDKKDRKQKKARDLQEKKPAREEKTHTAEPPKK